MVVDVVKYGNSDWITGHNIAIAGMSVLLPPDGKSMVENVIELNHHNSRMAPRTLVWLGTLFGVAFYLVDVLVDTYIFHRGDLWAVMLQPSGHELWMRFMPLFVCFLFAVYAYQQYKRVNKTAERALTAEKFLSSVIDNIPDMIFIKDAQDLRFVCVNKATERILGIPGKELLGRNDYDFFPGLQADFFTGKDREVLQTGKLISIPEEEIESKHLGARILRTTKLPIYDDAGQPAYLLGIAEDITESWEAAKALEETEIRFQTLFNSAAEFIFVIDSEGKILLTNRHAIECSGYAEREIVGSNIMKFFTEKSQQTCGNNFPRLRERGQSRADIEFVCKDGRILQMECSATAVPEENGDYRTFLIIQRDVTERTQAAVALANSERRFKAIFNSTYQLIGLLDANGTVLEVNQTALDFAGMELADVVGKPFWKILWGGLSPSARERIREAIRNAAGGSSIRYEEELALPDGRRRILDVTLKPVTDENGETVLIIPEGRDITDSRLAEEDARRHLQDAAHVMRLGTMGELASTIAHELNQPLTAMVSYCGTAKSITSAIPPQPEKLVEILDHAMEQAHRASNIIQHFREFVCKGNQHRERVSLEDLIAGATGLLRGELHSAGIKVEFHPGSESCSVFVDRIELEQVILNLLRNSIDAIVQSGRNDGLIELYAHPGKENAVELTIIDNGPGVAPEQLDHIFEPFISTKASGMGMGLSISRSIVESHGGRLWYKKQQHEGAQFGLTLPECRN
jgi:two-component system sensor kinase FixL